MFVTCHNPADRDLAEPLAEERGADGKRLTRLQPAVSTVLNGPKDLSSEVILLVLIAGL